MIAAVWHITNDMRDGFTWGVLTTGLLVGLAALIYQEGRRR